MAADPTFSPDDPPAEIWAYAQDVRDLLGLGAWDIEIKMVDAIDEDDEGVAHSAAADCTYEEPYKVATIRLVWAKNEDEADWRLHVMHEMIHIAIAPMDHAARQVAYGLVRTKLQVHALSLIGDGLERSVSALAKALVRGVKPSVKP